MCLSPNYITAKGKFVGYMSHGLDGYIPVPCGHCIECERSKANEWAFRVMLEYNFNPCGCVITLTYDNEHLPPDGELNKRDYQLFLKSLRQAIAPIKVRYFLCGEYGSQNRRPHYHLILLGFSPKDCTFVKRTSKGTRLYRSKFIERLWKKGICSVSDVNAESVRYSAKYLQKFFDFADKKIKPFVVMSRRPGLGFANALDYADKTVAYFEGHKQKIPRYFNKVAEKAGYDLTTIKERRQKNAEVLASLQDKDSVEKRKKRYEELWDNSHRK